MLHNLQIGCSLWILNHQLFFRVIKNLLYLLLIFHFLVLSYSLCRSKFPFVVIFLMPKEVPLIFHGLQMCLQCILSAFVFLRKSLLCFYYWRIYVLSIEVWIIFFSSFIMLRYCSIFFLNWKVCYNSYFCFYI